MLPQWWVVRFVPRSRKGVRFRFIGLNVTNQVCDHESTEERSLFSVAAKETFGNDS